MTNKVIPLNSAPRMQLPKLRRQMVMWYINNVKEAGIVRNPAKGKLNQMPLWDQVSNPDYTLNGKQTDLCNYCARTYIDKLDAEDMQAIVNLVKELVKEAEYNPNINVDEKHLHNLFTVMKNLEKGHYDLGFHWKHKENRRERWHLVQTLFEIIDQS